MTLQNCNIMYNIDSCLKLITKLRGVFMFGTNKMASLKAYIDCTRRAIDSCVYDSDDDDEGLRESVEAVITQILAGKLKRARRLIEEVMYLDFQMQLFCICAIASDGSEEDLGPLRELVELHERECGPVQRGMLLFIARLSGMSYDIQKFVKSVEGSDPFAMVHNYLALFQAFECPEYLNVARRAANTEVSGMPFFKTAGLTMLALFTASYDDFHAMVAGLQGINEADVRSGIPMDIGVDGILAKAGDFSTAFDAVMFIDIEYMRAKVWTLIGIMIAKKVSLSIASIPICV
jgi:hypothetical protein